ncbi:MAG TPA: S66 family peptidase [Candidatus Wunengus sp. YC63]|uniref:S66 family peptidase n=1 Tax=Candidatus Wunengus sp. YC63 TaxID=3367699 RepID=UPI002713084F|nr:LD-carboxypeptidase [Candidatus Brocadiales bacterium]
MELFKPRRLFEGARVAVISPSYPGVALFQARVDRAVAALKKLGLEVIFAPNAKLISGFTAGSDEARVKDLHWAFSNPQIHCVLSAIGGLNSNAMLPLLDFDLIRANPKVFIGYSDVTTLLLSILSFSRLVTFHGPALLPEWGEFPTPFDYTISGFYQATFRSEPLGCLVPPENWTDEFLDWEIGADNRARQLRRGGDWHFLIEGDATGILFGGNIDTINFLCGTKYLRIPDENIILLLEVTHLSPAAFDRSLEHLLQANIFERVQGIVFARYHAYDKASGDIPKQTTEKLQEEIDDVLLSKIKRLKVPIISRVACGHTDPMLTIPLGVEARISSFDERFEIIEAAVTA